MKRHTRYIACQNSWCGKIRATQKQTDLPKFCSDRCAQHSRYPEPLEIRVCEGCGLGFPVSAEPNITHPLEGKWCSRPCRTVEPATPMSLEEVNSTPKAMVVSYAKELSGGAMSESRIREAIALYHHKGSVTPTQPFHRRAVDPEHTYIKAIDYRKWASRYGNEPSGMPQIRVSHKQQPVQGKVALDS